MSKLIEDVRQAIEPILIDAGIELVDIEFEKKYGEDNLTVFIENTSGITLDECEMIHRAIDPILDDLDPTNGKPYILNVSSPGLDRPFKSQRDYQRNYGKEVELKLYAPLKGKKLLKGTLMSHDQNTTTIRVLQAFLKLSAKNGKAAGDKKDDTSGDLLFEEIKIENTRIAYTRPLVKFN